MDYNVRTNHRERYKGHIGYKGLIGEVCGPQTPMVREKGGRSGNVVAHVGGRQDRENKAEQVWRLLSLDGRRAIRITAW